MATRPRVLDHTFEIPGEHVPAMLRSIAFMVFVGGFAGISQAQGTTPGRTAREEVAAATRLDWVFPLANQSLAAAPAEWLKDYDSTEQTYELYVPESYTPDKSWPAVIFISAGDAPAGLPAWQDTCRKQGIVFASPHGAGNNCPLPRRVRIVLDVLDDLRQKYHLDPDRIYIGGFSGGARVACAIAFALPEYFGGVIPVCAGGELRSESWLRQRVVDRLSVAQVTGETDFNRGEVERFRQTQLSGVGVRCKTWVVSGMGHAIPRSTTLAEVFAWLDERVVDRRKLATQWPASRIADAPDRGEWADRVLAEGKKRLAKPPTQYAGLMQLQGIHARWNDLPQAKSAFQILMEYDQKDNRPWEQDDIAEQRRFLIARARGVDAYASGPIPQPYERQHADMLRAAIGLWQQVIADGQDAVAVAEAQERIPLLEKLLPGATKP